MQDALAVESHRRAAAAVAEGRFNSQIVAVEIKTRKGVTLFDTDEHVRRDSPPESLAALCTAFDKLGTVTAGNLSGINDGAAALVLATGEVIASRRLAPMARIVAGVMRGLIPS